MSAKAFILTLALVSSGLCAGATGPNAVRDGWRHTWSLFGVDPAIAESVIWPEMQLYSGIRDAAEATADYGSYVSGVGSFDFSIGIFQMKPSFVEKLEKAWTGSSLAGVYGLSFDTSDTSSARHSRLARMGVAEWQVIYLALFLRLLYSCYGIGELPVEDQVRLSATAYNRGCEWTEPGCGSIEALRKYSDVVSFPRVIIRTPGTRQYCYATLAWEHYRSITSNL